MIKLTSREADLIEKFNLLHVPSSNDEFERTKEPILQLVNSLLDRKAVPAHRMAWFVEREYNPSGRGKSRLEHWQFRGHSSNSMIIHPTFRGIIKYWITGPNLCPQITNAMQQLVEKLGPITSSDAEPLAKESRKLARQFSLGHEAKEEFYQLGLELGLSCGFAEVMRDAISSMR